MPNAYMPVSLAMTNRSCLVVGGGMVALRKVDTLLDYKTTITVVAPEVIDKLSYFAERGKITLEKRPYQPREASAYELVIAASDDTALNRQVGEDCRLTNTPVNVVDDPEHCSFIFPAVLKRDCLSVAVATDGKAPFMSGHLRVILDTIFPQHWNQLMRHAAAFRKQVQARWGSDSAKKQDCYQRFLDADWKTILKEKDAESIRQALDQMLDEQETVA
jgi:siroheme synthase-like protein